jgi:hypothetical protein
VRKRPLHARVLEREIFVQWIGYVLAVAFFPLMVSTAAAVTTCTVTEKYSCSPGNGCKSILPAVEVRIDWNEKLYSRCDKKGCDDLKMNFSVSGDFINIDIPEHSALAKISKDGSSYLEVVTLMTTAVVSHGSCRIE